MQKEIKQTWFFKREPKEVWDYLTKPELIEQWLMKTDFKPVIGHKFSFIGGCSNNHDSKEAAQCEVLELKPYSHLSYSWLTKSLKDNKPYTSLVAWTLTPKDKGTELQLVHNGFVELVDREAHNDGWTRIGNNIVESLHATKA